jgi:hypothetical protein
MQRLKNKLNLTASIAMIYMIIKKRKENLNENGTRVSSIISKDATT